MSDLTDLIRHLLLDEGVIKNSIKIVQLEDGEILFHQNDDSDGFYFIKAGQIRVFTLGPVGEEVSSSIVSTGDILGEQTLLGPCIYSTTAIALTSCTVLSVSWADFFQLVSHWPDYAHMMIELLIGQVRNQTIHVKQLEFWMRMLTIEGSSPVLQALEQAQDGVQNPLGDRSSSLEHVELVVNLAKTIQEREDNLRKQVFYQLEKGWEIQKNFLPNRLLQIPNWEIAASFQPARQVAGDFYDVFKISEHAVALVLADVCDKGVGAALFMALFRSLIRIYATQSQQRGRAFPKFIGSQPVGGWLGESKMINIRHLSILQAVSLTNAYVSQNHGEMGMFATLFFGVLDPTTGLLSYINAGHEPLIITKQSGGVREQLKATNPAVGIIPNVSFQICQRYLNPGETLFGYTDGVTDARAIDGSFFTATRLLEHLDTPIISAQDLIQSISSSLQTHVGEAEQFDDITLLAVRRQ